MADEGWDDGGDARRQPGHDRELSIGVFARRSLLSLKALRRYEQLGLLCPASVDPVTGYRRYREHQLEPARLINRLRRLDMPLAAVAEVVAAPPARRAAVVGRFWDGVEQTHAARRELVGYLQDRLDGGRGIFHMHDIHERDVPEQLVLTEQRHLTVGDLADWVPATIGRHWQVGEGFGGVSGPVLVIFHGQVDEDGDGPVEVCAPIAPTAEQREQLHTVATRIEPAHREAYTRITKAQVGFPQILAAYDAVGMWVHQRGKTTAGSPREVYFTDLMAAAPDDEACDVAFPIAESGAQRG